MLETKHALKRYSEPDEKLHGGTFSAPQPAAKCNICSARDLVQSTHKNRNLKRCRQRAHCVAPKSKKGKAAANGFFRGLLRKREVGSPWPIGQSDLIPESLGWKVLKDFTLIDDLQSNNSIQARHRLPGCWLGRVYTHYVL